MRALGGGQPGRDRLGLRVVLRACPLRSKRVDHGQHELRPEAAREPGERARAPAGAAPARAGAPSGSSRPRQNSRMRLLDRGEAAIDLLELRIVFGLGERAVERRAVDLALEVAAIAADRVGVGSRSLCSPRLGA